MSIDAAVFAQQVSGEVVAGCVIGFVDGKRVYLFRNDELTPEGQVLYDVWQQGPEVKVPAKRGRPRKEQDHG